MNCPECNDTGVIKPDNRIYQVGDYCNCKAGIELQEMMEGCGVCPNIDTETTCEEYCPILPMELDKCGKCGKYYEGIYGQGVCHECRKETKEEDKDIPW